MSFHPTFYFTTANDATVGPVSRADLETAMRSPDWFPGALVWREGWADWLDWRKAAAEIGIVGLPAGTTQNSGTRARGQAGRASGREVGAGGFYTPPAARLHSGVAVIEGEVDIVPASFAKRFAAWFIDQIVLNLALFILMAGLAIIAAMVAPGAGDSDEPPLLVAIAYLIVVPSLYLGYYAFFDSSASGATLGKKLLAIRVTDLDGRRIGVLQSIARTLSCALSYVILYIGFLMALVTERKQALHDLIARTLVIEKDPNAGSSSSARVATIAIAIVAVGMLGIMIIAILAAIALPAYSDYTRRSQVVSAIQETEPVRLAILRHWSENGECPQQGTGEFGAREAYAGKYHSAVEFPAYPSQPQDDVACTIRIVMRGGEGVGVEGSLVLNLYPDGRQACLNETISRRFLPPSCRSDAAP